MTQPKVPAADQTLRILRLLSTSRGPMAASMIAKQLELPRSTVYHLLATLQDHGFVVHLPEDRRFGLGIAAFELSSAYARQEPLTRIARPLFSQFVDRVGLSAHLAVAHGRDVLYVIEERAKGTAALVSDVNVRLPMHLTASGRAILAAMPKAQVRALYPDADAFVTRYDNTVEPSPESEKQIASYSQLRAVLNETVLRGYALERGSVTKGLSSVARPVLDHQGWPVAAIAVTFRDEERSPEHIATLALQVAELADTLSSRIHGRRQFSATVRQ